MQEQPSHAEILDRVERVEERQVATQAWILRAAGGVLVAGLASMWAVIWQLRAAEDTAIARESAFRAEVRSTVQAALENSIARTDGLLNSMVEIVSHNREEIAEIKSETEMNTRAVEGADDNSKERMQNHIDRQHGGR